MEAAEILRQLERDTGRFARAAVEAAVARREEVVPGLLRVLDDTVERAAQLDAETWPISTPCSCWRSFARFALIPS